MMMGKTDNPFDVYRMPPGLVDAVRIPLPQTKASFMVRLPGIMNEDFNMMLMSEVNADVDDEGKITLDKMEYQRLRRQMFFENCIVSARGLPDGMDHTEFFKTYPLAARYIWEQATELSVDADEAAQDALGKLQPTPSGNTSGVGSTKSTKGLSKRGAKSQQSAPI